MKIPTVEIEALCAYVEIDLKNGVQMNVEDWRQSLSKVREWLEAVEHTLAPDGAVCPAHQTYFEEDGTCAIAGCKETRPAGKA